jgi:hypothetical protein
MIFQDAGCVPLTQNAMSGDYVRLDQWTSALAKNQTIRKNVRLMNSTNNLATTSLRQHLAPQQRMRLDCVHQRVVIWDKFRLQFNIPRRGHPEHAIWWE